MNKKYLLFFIFLLIVIALLVLTILVPGFGAGLYANVWIPLVNVVGGAFGVVASNPFWHITYGYITIFALGGLTVIVLAWLFWPSLKQKKPVSAIKKTLQPKVMSSNPVRLETQSTQQVVEEANVVEEAKVE